MDKNINEAQKQCTIHSVINRAFLISFMPKWVQNSIKIQGLMEEEIAKTEKLMGKEKTKELIERFKNEAFATPYVVNHEYIITNLHKARESFRHGL